MKELQFSPKREPKQADLYQLIKLADITAESEEIMNSKFKQKAQRLISGLVAAAMAITMLPQMPAFAETGTITYSYDGYDVEYSVLNEWDNGQTVEVKVTNTGDDSILNWALKYDADGEISNLWNADVYDNQGEDYIIKNGGWNYEITPGQTVNFGYTLFGDNFVTPEAFELCSRRIEVASGYETNLNIIESWDTGIKAELVITNTSDNPLEAWTLSFDSNFTIDNLWDARILESVDSHYTIASEMWTNPIAVGSSKTIAFVGTKAQDIGAAITNFELSVVEIEGLTHIDLNTNNIDLGYIEELISSGLITANFDENSVVRAIDGKFTNKPLNSAEDAADILNCARTLFGNQFSADSTNITVQTDGDQTYYRLSAALNGVPVLGSQVILSAKDGEVTGLFNTYKKNAEGINTIATITEDTAIETVYNDIFTTYSSQIDAVVEYSGLTRNEVLEVFRASFTVTPILVVYTNETTPLLSWLIEIVNDNNNYDEEEDEEIEIDYTDINDYGKYVFNFINRQYYIQANGQNAGNIIRMNNGFTGAWETVNSDGTDKDLLGNDRDFNVQFKEGGLFSNDKYRMKDGDRNIETYYVTYNVITDSPQLPGEMYQSDTNRWSDSTSVSVHANMSDIYDFYKEELGRDSYDNNHAKIKVTTKFRAVDWSFFIFDFGNKEVNNAYWNGSQILIGDAGNHAAAKDTLAHEFTHAVDQYVIYDSWGPFVTSRGLNYYGETGALNEAYSDIMGMLAEGKPLTDKGRFTIGEDSGAVLRDFTSPGPDYADHYSALTDPTWDAKLNRYIDRDNEGVHIFSTIIDHAVYLMMDNPKTASITDKRWAQVFYDSMFKLGTSSDFHDFRYAVLSSAKQLGFTGDEQSAIKKAFDDVGITEPDSIRIVVSWGDTPRDLDSHLTGPAVSGSGRFHIYYSARNYYTNGSYNSTNLYDYAAELDYDVTSSYGPEITTIHRYTPGDYYFYVHDYSNKSSTNSTAMSTSGVTVSIYHGSSNTFYKLDDGTIACFKIPSSQIATLWRVCKINIDSAGNVTITKLDTYSNHSNPSSIGD